MRPRNSGTIVQVGSALAYRGIPLQTAYCGAKHAIQGFHESLRCELLHERSGIKVTMVQLPAVNTPQFSWLLSKLPRHAQPVPPIYQPEVAAAAVAARRASTRAGASTGSGLPPWPPWRRTRSRPGCWTATSPGPGSAPSRPPPGASRTSRPTCGSRPTGPTGGTSAPTARFDDRAHTWDSATARLPPPRRARRGCRRAAGRRGAHAWRTPGEHRPASAARRYPSLRRRRPAGSPAGGAGRAGCPGHHGRPPDHPGSRCPAGRAGNRRRPQRQPGGPRRGARSTRYMPCPCW